MADPTSSETAGTRRELDLAQMRRIFGVGAYLCGHIDLDAAAEFAGQSVAALQEELKELGATASFRLEGQSQSDRPTLSVVVPVFNESENIGPLVERLNDVLDGIDYELIFVDDGSSDSSLTFLRSLHDVDPRIKIISLSRNFGHQNALAAGVDRARGRAIVLMDADGQDPPELVLEFMEKWRAGSDVVLGIRARRHERWWKQAAYRLFYRVLARVSDTRIPVDAGDFCLMDARVVDALRSLPESGQFLRGLRSWVGFEQVGVPYDRPPRTRGESTYSFFKLVHLALDGLLSFSSMPLRIVSWLGALTSLTGVLYLGVGIGFKLFVGHVPAGWTSLLAVIVLLGGAELMVVGVLGEYLARVYAETKRRPRYVIKETHL